MTYALTELGLSRQWDREEQREVRQGNAEHWRRWKRENGWTQTPVAEIPGFVESVQELYDYGYSLTDISAFFGVSRERVRQWFRDLPGLERHDDGGSMLREWDDDALCFLPVEPADVIERAKSRRKMARTERVARRHDRRRAAHVRRLKALAETLGRVPTTGEFVDHMQSCVAGIALYWGRPEKPYSECMDALWGAAGMVRPPMGHHLRGHEGPNAKLTEDDVRRIRRNYDGSWAFCEREAQRLGVTATAVWRAARGESWAHLEAS